MTFVYSKNLIVIDSKTIYFIAVDHDGPETTRFDRNNCPLAPNKVCRPM